MPGEGKREAPEEEVVEGAQRAKESRQGFEKERARDVLAGGETQKG
jgi:hypothetical protein